VSRRIEGQCGGCGEVLVRVRCGRWDTVRVVRSDERYIWTITVAPALTPAEAARIGPLGRALDAIGRMETKALAAPCVDCGEAFYHREGERAPSRCQTCERAARNASQRRRRAAGRVVRSTCERCGGALPESRAARKWCSDACRQAAYRTAVTVSDGSSFGPSGDHAAVTVSERLSFEEAGDHA
jgi:hypothetical protein